MRNFLTALFILFLLLPARVMAQGGTSGTPIGPAALVAFRPWRVIFQD